MNNDANKSYRPAYVLVVIAVVGGIVNALLNVVLILDIAKFSFDQGYWIETKPSPLSGGGWITPNLIGWIIALFLPLILGVIAAIRFDRFKQVTTTETYSAHIIGSLSSARLLLAGILAWLPGSLLSMVYLRLAVLHGESQYFSLPLLGFVCQQAFLLVTIVGILTTSVVNVALVGAAVTVSKRLWTGILLALLLGLPLSYEFARNVSVIVVSDTCFGFDISRVVEINLITSMFTVIVIDLVSLYLIGLLVIREVVRLKSNVQQKQNG